MGEDEHAMPALKRDFSHRSPWEDFAPQTFFRRIIIEGGPGDNMSRRGAQRPSQEVRRIVLCSGKVFYDLYHARAARKVSTQRPTLVRVCLCACACVLVCAQTRIVHACTCIFRHGGGGEAVEKSTKDKAGQMVATILRTLTEIMHGSAPDGVDLSTKFS
jgi:hypothetical protein